MTEPKTHFKTQLPPSLAIAAARVRKVGESDSEFVRLAIAELVADRLWPAQEIPDEWLDLQRGPKPK